MSPKPATFALLILLGLVLPLATAQNLVVQSPQQLTIDNVHPFIDQQLKSTWWQYLRGANLLYHGRLDEEDRYLFLSIHRNIVGTFLSIVQWVNGEKQIKVETLVRLGNGFQANSEAKYAGVQVDPVNLSFKLGEGEFFVDTNEKGELQVNGEVVADSNEGSVPLVALSAPVVITDESKAKLAQRCTLLDKWIRENNWHYLRDAENVHRSGRITNQRNYCVFNYVNIVGTFFVLASTDLDGEDSSLDTFVRLGDGYQKDSEAKYGPVIFEPVVLQFDLLKN